MNRVLSVALLLAVSTSGAFAQTATDLPQSPNGLPESPSGYAASATDAPVAGNATALAPYNSCRFCRAGVACNSCNACGQGAAVHAVVEMLKTGYHRNMCWPKPFIYPDRQRAMAPFAVMTNNGWRRQNLLGKHHFRPDGSSLNVAGQLKVQWVLTQAPVHRRSIYVVRDMDSEISLNRLATVRKYAAQLLPADVEADVRDTHLIAEGRPAALVDAINVRFAESMPPPVLPPPGNDRLSTD